MKAFADNSLNVTQMLVHVSYRVENIVEKDYSIFPFFDSVFKRLLPQGYYKSGLCVKGLTLSQTINFTLFQTERICRLQF